MRTKIFTVAAIICLVVTFAGEVQAMAVIGHGAELQECAVRVRHRRVIRRVVPRVVISPVVVITNNRYYRHSYPPPPRRHWRYYRKSAAKAPCFSYGDESAQNLLENFL